MITGKDMYDVMAAVVPLYVAMMLAYCSVRWWKIFTPDQCSAINRFVAVFAIPFLSFHFISSNNPYKMNYQLIAADSLQKVVILSALFLWQTFSKHGSLEWMITLFSLSTIPNNLIMGIPLLGAMYGDFSRDLMVQILVLQNMIWYTLLLFTDQFLETAGSFRVDSDVVSLDGREPTPRASSFNQTDFYAMFNASKAPSPCHGFTSGFGGDVYSSFQPSKGATPRASNFDEDVIKKSRKGRAGRSMSDDYFNNNGNDNKISKLYCDT